jgi:hypothetical protein
MTPGQSSLARYCAVSLSDAIQQRGRGITEPVTTGPSELEITRCVRNHGRRYLFRGLATAQAADISHNLISCWRWEWLAG